MADIRERESLFDRGDSLCNLGESFRAALVLTGSVEGAERALDEAIAVSGSEISPHGLLTETIRSILRGTIGKESALPLELQALALLAPIARCCFVLRLGVGLDLQTCSEMLGISTGEVEDALCHAVVELPKAVRRVETLAVEKEKKTPLYR